MKRSKKLSWALFALASSALVASTAIGLASCTTTNTSTQEQIKQIDITDKDALIINSASNLLFKSSSANGELTYDWKISKDGEENWKSVQNSSLNTLKISNNVSTEETWFLNLDVYSNSKVVQNKKITLSVQPENYHGSFWIESISTSNSVAIAGELGPTLSVKTDSIWGTTLQYQWMVAKDGYTFKNIEGATSSTYTIPRNETNSLKEDTKWVYAVMVSNGLIWTQSDNLTIDIKTKDVVITGQSDLNPILYTNSATTLKVDAKYKGEKPLKYLVYEWWIKYDGKFVLLQSGSSNLLKVTKDTTYIDSSKNGNYEIYCNVYPLEQKESAQFSQKFNLKVHVINEDIAINKLTINGSSTQSTIKAGDTATLAVNAISSIDNSKLKYQWMVAKNSYSFKNIDGATSSTYTIPASETQDAAGQNWTYAVQITGSLGEYTTQSDNLYLSIISSDSNTNVENETATGDVTVSANSYGNASQGTVFIDSNYNTSWNATYEVKATSGFEANDDITYQWYYTFDGKYQHNSGTKIDGATNSQLTPDSSLLKTIYESGKTATFYCKVYKNGKLATIGEGYWFSLKVLKN